MRSPGRVIWLLCDVMLWTLSLAAVWMRPCSQHLLCCITFGRTESNRAVLICFSISFAVQSWSDPLWRRTCSGIGPSRVRPAYKHAVVTCHDCSQPVTSPCPPVKSVLILFVLSNIGCVLLFQVFTFSCFVSWVQLLLTWQIPTESSQTE